MHRIRFADHDGALGPSSADTDQRTAVNLRVGINNSFTGDGKYGVLGGLHAMGFSAAEPKSILFVEVTHVTHAVPKGIAVGYFMTGIGICPRHILIGNDWSTHHKFAHHTWFKWNGIADLKDRCIVDGDYSPIDLWKTFANTGSFAAFGSFGCFVQDDGSGVAGNGKRFGRTVGRESIAIR